jgi:hypothetical protein
VTAADAWDEPWTQPATPDTEPDPIAIARLFDTTPPPRPLALIDAWAFTAAATAAGWSAQRIAARAGVSERTVRGWRDPRCPGPPTPRICGPCGGPLPYDATGRPRRYHEGECHRAGVAAQAASGRRMAVAS